MNERSWGQEHELLASLIEIVDFGNRNFETAHSRKGAPKRQPVQVPRPHRRSRGRQMSSPDEVRAFMARR